MKALTVKELGKMCMQAIAGGYGDREILLAADDEGNYFRMMFYGFTADEDTLTSFADMGCLECEDIEKVILLG